MIHYECTQEYVNLKYYKYLVPYYSCLFRNTYIMFDKYLFTASVMVLMLCVMINAYGITKYEFIVKL